MSYYLKNQAFQLKVIIWNLIYLMNYYYIFQVYLQFIKNLLKLFRFLQPPLGYQFPGLLPQRPVRFLQKPAHLRQRLFLAEQILYHETEFKKLNN